MTSQHKLFKTTRLLGAVSLIFLVAACGGGSGGPDIKSGVKKTASGIATTSDNSDSGTNTTSSDNGGDDTTTTTSSGPHNDTTPTLTSEALYTAGSLTRESVTDAGIHQVNDVLTGTGGNTGNTARDTVAGLQGMTSGMGDANGLPANLTHVTVLGESSPMAGDGTTAVNTALMSNGSNSPTSSVASINALGSGASGSTVAGVSALSSGAPAASAIGVNALTAQPTNATLIGANALTGASSANGALANVNALTGTQAAGVTINPAVVSGVAPVTPMAAGITVH